MRFQSPEPNGHGPVDGNVLCGSAAGRLSFVSVAQERSCNRRCHFGHLHDACDFDGDEWSGLQRDGNERFRDLHQFHGYSDCRSGAYHELGASRSGTHRWMATESDRGLGWERYVYRERNRHSTDQLPVEREWNPDPSDLIGVQYKFLVVADPKARFSVIYSDCR
jgi:hypothetical protein